MGRSKNQTLVTHETEVVCNVQVLDTLNDNANRNDSALVEKAI